MRFEPPSTSRRRVSLTPLIDVVFILLVFFMLATSLARWQPLPITAPAPTQAVPSTETPRWQVRVHLDGLELDGEWLEDALLTQRLRAHPQQPVTLRPADGVTVQRLIDVLDQLRAVGADAVRLAGD